MLGMHRKILCLEIRIIHNFRLAYFYPKKFLHSRETFLSLIPFPKDQQFLQIKLQRTVNTRTRKKCVWALNIHFVKRKFQIAYKKVFRSIFFHTMPWLTSRIYSSSVVIRENYAFFATSATFLSFTFFF